VSVEKRFNKYVRRTKKCWHWLGTPKGRYGKFTIGGRNDYVHRIAYEMWVGPLEPGAVVHHKCGNSRCVRPSHLQAISQANNLAEMFERQNYQRAIRRLEAEIARLNKELGERP